MMFGMRAERRWLRWAGGASGTGRGCWRRGWWPWRPGSRRPGRCSPAWPTAACRARRVGRGLRRPQRRQRLGRHGRRGDRRRRPGRAEVAARPVTAVAARVAASPAYGRSTTRTSRACAPARRARLAATAGRCWSPSTLGDLDRAARDAADDRGHRRAARARGRPAAPGPPSRSAAAPVLSRQTARTVQEDLQRAEFISLPLTLVVLLVVFGGLVAAGLPVLTAAVSVAAAMGVLLGFSTFTDVDQDGVTVVTLLGLGLSVDYGLLLVARYREELLRAATPPDVAVARAWATAGRTIAVQRADRGGRPERPAHVRPADADRARRGRRLDRRGRHAGVADLHRGADRAVAHAGSGRRRQRAAAAARTAEPTSGASSPGCPGVVQRRPCWWRSAPPRLLLAAGARCCRPRAAARAGGHAAQHRVGPGRRHAGRPVRPAGRPPRSPSWPAPTRRRWTPGPTAGAATRRWPRCGRRSRSRPAAPRRRRRSASTSSAIRRAPRPGTWWSGCAPTGRRAASPGSPATRPC